jgi:leucyl-tRNA synthetase
MKTQNSKLKIPNKYFPKEIEQKWHEVWEKDGIYKFDELSKKEKYYNLVELPYPSGDLHIGHWFTFVYADAHARYKKMTGKNVFFPNGFDAFGLPAENAAIKKGVHPKDWTMKNVETMKSQFGTMGTIIDWDYTAITCLPEYYKWNNGYF